MTDEPIVERRDHIIREGRLPWRDEPLTECGRLVADVGNAITREQAAFRHKKIGQQRMAFTVCMTCYHTANNAPQWDTDPSAVLYRDYRRDGHRLVYYHHDRKTGETTGPFVDRLSVELHAIADLIAAYPNEFAVQVQAHTDAALFAHRRALAEQRKAQSNATPPRPIGHK